MYMNNKQIGSIGIGHQHTKHSSILRNYIAKYYNIPQRISELVNAKQQFETESKVNNCNEKLV